VVEAYAQRWSVESLFAALKLTDGMGAMWQRGRRTLLRWLHLVQIGRALLVLLTARAEPEVLALSAGRWLAQAGDADAGPGQGRACPPVARYAGLPPRARNPQENRPGSWYRPTRERHYRMTSGSNPTSAALPEP